MEDPTTRLLIQQRAEQHTELLRQQEGEAAVEPQALMMSAMEKLAVARQQLASAGIDERVSVDFEGRGGRGVCVCVCHVASRDQMRRTKRKERLSAAGISPRGACLILAPCSLFSFPRAS